LTTEINTVAATQELAIQEKAVVVQEPGDHDDGDDEEIPQLVPVQTTSLAGLKVVVSSY